MFGVFNWLRSQAKQAVLGGVADALADLAPADQPADLERLRALLAGEAKALPAAKPEAEEPAAPVEPEAAPVAPGGKRKK